LYLLGGGIIYVGAGSPEIYSDMAIKNLECFYASSDLLALEVKYAKRSIEYLLSAYNKKTSV